MPIPPSLMPGSYAQTIAAIRDAIENRITNATNRLSVTPTYHRGIPDAGAIQNDALSVWLDWTNIDPDEDEPERVTMLQSQWLITIVGHDEGNDPFGADSPLVEKVWGDIMTTLTETAVDVGLDGTCDFVPTPRARKSVGSLSGSERKVMTIEIDLTVHQSAELVLDYP